MHAPQLYTGDGLRLHVGCGKWIFDGYVNIDVQPSELAPREPDILCDIKAIPLPDGCAKEVLGVHIFEHIDRWESESALQEWARLLQPGGRLILEMPDLMKCCRNILKGVEGKHPDQMGLWGLYGDWMLRNPHMMHRWAWTFATLQPLVANCGFVDVVERDTEFHSSGRRVRDFRLEAVKA